MNYQHREGDPFFNLNYNQGVLKCHRNNTTLYTFSEQPEGNHIFIVYGYEANGLCGSIIWEQMYRNNNSKKFEQLKALLIKARCPELEYPYMSLADACAFESTFKRLPDLIEPKMHAITPRQELRLSFFGHLLENNVLKPDDFLATGDLHI